MKRFTRDQVIRIISKLGGEDEKKKALSASSQSPKNEMRPLVQATWSLVAKGKKGDLRLFADSDAFDSSDDESENESEEVDLAATGETSEGGKEKPRKIRRKPPRRLLWRRRRTTMLLKKKCKSCNG